jgi:hypothetical protein
MCCILLTSARFAEKLPKKEDKEKISKKGMLPQIMLLGREIETDRVLHKDYLQHAPFLKASMKDWQAAEN